MRYLGVVVRGLLVGLLLQGSVSTSLEASQAAQGGPDSLLPTDVESRQSGAVEGLGLQGEVRRLSEGISRLEGSVQTLSSDQEKGPDWPGIVVPAITALLVLVFGAVINSSQRSKAKQDADLGREEHLMTLFKGLGDESSRVRMGAVAILVQRLRNEVDSGLANGEYDTIVNLLITSTKHEDSVEIQKYIADGLYNALSAAVPEGGTPRDVSPLAKYNFQGARLSYAWWRRVDARAVDFYEACLTGAGLREALLNRAVFKRADLSNATLIDAKLREANLQYADLTDAKLSGADLTDADLTGARLEGADLSGATLDGAIGLGNG